MIAYTKPFKFAMKVEVQKVEAHEPQAVCQ